MRRLKLPINRMRIAKILSVAFCIRIRKIKLFKFFSHSRTMGSKILSQLFRFTLIFSFFVNYWVVYGETELHILHEGNDAIYFISSDKADIKTAEAECKAHDNSQLVSIQSIETFEELFNELRKNDIDSVWTSGHEGDKSSGFWSPSLSNLWTSPKFSKKVQRSAAANPPFKFPRSPRSIISLCPGPFCSNPADPKNCDPSPRPKCEVAECTIHLPDDCKTTIPPCTILTKPCQVHRPPCTSTCKPCKLVKPNCTIVQKPCSVDNSKPCVIEQPDCTIEDRNCHTVRPPCTTYTPPCNVTLPPPCGDTTKPTCRPERPCTTTQAPCSTQPPCTTTIPPCYDEPQPCTYKKRRCVTEIPANCSNPGSDGCPEVTICEPEGKTCPPPKRICPPATQSCPEAIQLCPVTTCKPTIICAEVCQSPAVFCPVQQTYCPPPITTCTKPEVKCPTAKPICPKPDVICPEPEYVCPPVQIECPTPEITCPQVTVHCPQPEYVCPQPIVECSPPNITCPTAKPCEFPGDLPPCTTTAATTAIPEIIKVTMAGEGSNSKLISTAIPTTRRIVTRKTTTKIRRDTIPRCVSMKKNNSYKFELEDCAIEQRFICQRQR